MDILILFFIFILGLLVGSFLNVVIFRYNSNLSIVNGRSVCVYCNQKIRWYDLIPLFSFIFLRGKCRVCKMPISLQYPIVEFLTGILFAGIALRQYYYWYLFSAYQNGLLYSFLFFLYYCLVFCLLLVISFYDIKHKIIPNKLVYTFIVLAISKLFLFFYCFGFTKTLIDTLDILSPIILFIPFAVLWAVSSGKWIGFGDAKLAIGIGALLGFSLGLSSIIVAFWIGALWSVSLMMIDRFYRKNSVTMKTEIPFAPFMVIALVLVFFTHIDVLNLNDILSYLQ